MANSTQVAVSDGSLALLDISIDYLSRPEITVYFDAVLTTDWAWVGDSDKQITFDPVVPNGVEVLVKRTTDISELRHTFSLGAAFTTQSLDEDLKQVLHIVQEASEANFGSDFYGDINMHNYRVRFIGTAIDDTDALSLAQYKADALGAWAARLAAEGFALAAAQSADDAVTQVNGVLRTGDTMTGPLALAADAASAMQAVPLQQLTAVAAAVTASVKQALNPVGSLYFNATDGTNPATLLGFGTWVAWGTGRVPVGIDAGNPAFNGVEETGGSADAVVVAHTHTGSTDTEPNHTHTSGDSVQMSGSFAAGQSMMRANTSSSTGAAGAHDHVVTIDSTGVSGVNANLQPYITVYIWKRTA